jgi:hypothetical protein
MSNDSVAMDRCLRIPAFARPFDSRAGSPGPRLPDRSFHQTQIWDVIVHVIGQKVPGQSDDFCRLWREFSPAQRESKSQCYFFISDFWHNARAKSDWLGGTRAVKKFERRLTAICIEFSKFLELWQEFGSQEHFGTSSFERKMN